MASRNNREGSFVGVIRGKNVRAQPKIEKHTDVWKTIFGDYSWNDETWPSTDDAWVIMAKRGVHYTVYKPRYFNGN